MKQIVGGFSNPDGTPVAGGRMFLKLTQDASAIGGPQITGNDLVSFDLDSNGQLPATTLIWFNDELIPSGTAYQVSVLAAGGGLVYGPEYFIFAGTSPTNIDNMFPSIFGGNVPVFSTAILANPTVPQTITGQSLTLTSTAPLFAAKIENVRYADQYSGSDIFAKAVAAMLDAGANSVIVIPPGSYSVSTTLTAISKCKVIAEGCTFTYTGSGTAIKIQNVQEFEIALGGSTLTGPGTGGSTIGILLGIGSGGTNTLTQSTKISGAGILVTSFNKGFAIDGYAANGTYSNIIDGITSRANNIGFYIIPTSANFANANTFSNCFADASISDGWKIDGCTNWFTNDRSENNGGFGFNLPGTQTTQNNVWSGGWSESNTSGDFNSGNAANVFYNSIYGTTINSATRFVGTWDGAGAGNTVIPAQLAFGGGIYLPINPMAGTGNGPFAVVNQEGGQAFVLAVSRSGVNAGQVLIGTTQYPVIFRGLIAQYNGVNTVSNGIPTEIATVDLINQNGAVGTTTLYSVPSSGAGQYRVCWNAKVTTPAGVSSTLGALTIVYTDPDGVAQTIVATGQTRTSAIAATETTNTTAAVLLGMPLQLNCKASTNITYAMAYASNAANAMIYNLHIKLEAM